MHDGSNNKIISLKRFSTRTVLQHIGKHAQIENRFKNQVLQGHF